jgi:predicted nucleotidyltransferase
MAAVEKPDIFRQEVEKHMNQHVQGFFEDSLETFIEVIKEDQSILAAILFGSLVSGFVWEKSDVDIILVSNDEKTPYKFYWLDESDLNYQVTVYSRNQFKRSVEQALAGSWVWHMIQTSKVLYSKDQTIDEYLLNAQALGKRDVELQLLTIIATVIGDLEKAEKFLLLRENIPQSYLFVTRLLDPLAQIVGLLNGEIPGREVIQQAMEFEPGLFHLIFSEVILRETDNVKLRSILEAIRDYITEHTPDIFRVILTYFQTEGDIRSLSDLTYHLNKMMPSDWWEIAVLSYGGWLVEQGYLERFSSPVRLTSKSRVQVNEIGYIYAG